MTLTGDPSLIDPGFSKSPKNPLILLQRWLEMADKMKVCEPQAMVLSTVNFLQQPSSRVVLLKECDAMGVTFSTSQESAKGKDLEKNSWAAGNLYWRETLQQVNFQGWVRYLAEEESNRIFQARPRTAQAVAALSEQSVPLKNEALLRKKIARLVGSGEKILRPKNWHAYYLAVTSIEFWHGSPDRFHKRLRYELDAKGVWSHQRLQP